MRKRILSYPKFLCVHWSTFPFFDLSQSLFASFFFYFIFLFFSSPLSPFQPWGSTFPHRFPSFFILSFPFFFSFLVHALQARAVELSLIPYRRSSSTHYTVCRSPFSPLLFDGPHLMDFGPNQRPSTLFKSVSLHFIPLVTLPLFHYLVLFS